MKRYAAVLFPDTVPDERILFPLVPVFQPIVYFQPVENDPEGQRYSPLCEQLCRESLCRMICPAPLNSDRDRFLHLLSDLRRRRDDYAGQLTHLSLAGIGSSGAGDAESKSTILSSLLDRHGIRQVKPDKKSMVLWQSRLILKLGEMFDESQQSLRREMDKIRAREQGLLAELRKETEQTFSFTERLISGSDGDEDQRLLKIKAWARLFALGEDSPADYRVFITTNSDTLGRLIEEYGALKNREAELIVDLSLPAGPNEDSQVNEELQRFTLEAVEYLKRFGLLLNKSKPEIEQAQEHNSWPELVERHFPAQTCGRRKLKLYSFKQVHARRFFLETFGSDEDINLLAGNRTGDLTDVIIGVLSPVDFVQRV